jgi:hypothetical protein
MDQGYWLFNPPQRKEELMGYQNIQQAFAKLGVTISVSNARLLLKRFDHDHDDYLSFMDIGGFFMPKNKPISDHLRQRT